MQWLDAPPVVTLDLVDETDGRIVCAGPSSSTRVEGGVNTAGGAVMALFGARFLRSPVPFVFPVLFLAAGAVSVVVGAVKLGGRCSFVVDDEGVTFRWSLPLAATFSRERTLRVPKIDVEWLGVRTRTWTTDNDHGGTDTREDFVLSLHTTDARVIPCECFPTWQAAVARRRQLELVLLR